MVDSHSPLTANAIRYAWQQLAQRAGLPEGETGDMSALGLPVLYAPLHEVDLTQPNIIIVPAHDWDWQALIQMAPDSIETLSKAHFAPPEARLPFDELPILFWGADMGHTALATRRDQAVVFHADLIAAAFFMLSRWEETVNPTRDEHDRFPATASVAYKQRFLGRPLLDELGLTLAAWLRTLQPTWRPPQRTGRIKLSHDVDHIRLLRRPQHGWRRLKRDIIDRHDLRGAWHTLQAMGGPAHDPYGRAIGALARLEATLGFQNAFYFLAQLVDDPDRRYDIDTDATRRIIDKLGKGGAEIGFHASYRAATDETVFAQEATKLRDVHPPAQGGRQHFLRFRVPQTWRYWETAGFSYDASLGYANQAGFRCGTCHRFQPYDVEQDRALNLREEPLIVMDSTLRQYERLTPETAQQRILDLYQRCQNVGGTLTLLWHNSSLHGPWWPWGRMYLDTLEKLACSSGRSFVTGSTADLKRAMEAR